jgi:hypothetical protein
MAQRVIVMELGDRTYEVPVAPIKRAKAWRKQLREPLDLIIATVQDSAALEISSVNDVLAIGKRIIPALMEAPDTLLDLVLAYAPTLKAERAYLDDNAVDEQVVDVFLSVLKVAFPLARLAALIGQATPGTSTSSPEPRGE